jgi:hypothetical protein
LASDHIPLPPQQMVRMVGRCIYCGSIEPPLTNEHYIPQGLNGTEYLGDASCEDCRKKTHAFETKVLRSMMWPIRRHVGAGGKRKKQQPEKIPTWITDESGNRVRAHLHHDEIPAKAVLPAFNYPPEILTGLWPTYEDLQLHILMDPEAVQRAREQGLPGTSIDFDMVAFVRLVAKIAHGHAVKLYGLEGFDPFLPEVIIGDPTKWPTVIGGAASYGPFPKTEQLARIDTHVLHEPHEGALLGRVRLFGMFAGPVYDVAIGRLKPPSP